MAPNGDQSQFQQWTYDTGTAQLTVGGQALYFTGSNGATAFGDDTSAPNNQWFAYPNYELLRIVNEPNSDPPFPAFPFPAPTDCGSSDSSLGDSAGEQAAYDYLSDLYLTGVQQNCTYEGTDYTGIRCEYTNLSGTSTLNTCASTSLSYYGDSDSNPGSYNGVTISDTDWQAVTCQLYLECQYAADVQTTFNYYNEIIDAVFISDSDLVTSLADDLGLSVSDSVNATALDVIQGVVQTVVWGAGGLGGAAAGVASAAFAEFLSTTTTVASDSNDLSEEITDEISAIYSDLSSQLQVLTDASANGENLILQDWGRLKQVGPLTEITGYNGLGLDSDDVSSLETSATQAYSLYVMQQLVPLAYGLTLNAGENFSDFSNQPTDTQASYPTFGQTSGSWNIGAFFYGTDYPDSTVMDDIWDNGAIAFEVANGINGWAGMPLGANGTNSNIGCAGTVITLFNLSSENLTVLASPSSGAVAAPGVQYNSNENQAVGSTDSFTTYIQPYGYVTIWGVSTGGISGDKKLELDVTITDADGNTVNTFTLETKKPCNGNGPDTSNFTLGSGWDGESFSQASSDNYPAAWWQLLWQD